MLFNKNFTNMLQFILLVTKYLNNSYKIRDPYRWLEDLDSAETKSFVSQQNDVTSAYLNQCKYRKEIQESLESIMNHTKYASLVKLGDRYFFQQSNGLENQKYVNKCIFLQSRM